MVRALAVASATADARPRSPFARRLRRIKLGAQAHQEDVPAELPDAAAAAGGAALEGVVGAEVEIAVQQVLCATPGSVVFVGPGEPLEVVIDVRHGAVEQQVA